MGQKKGAKRRGQRRDISQCVCIRLDVCCLTGGGLGLPRID